MKIKTLFIPIISLTAIVTPIVTVISCGSSGGGTQLHYQHDSIQTPTTWPDLKSGQNGEVPDDAIILDVDLRSITIQQARDMQNAKEEWINIPGAQFIVKITSATKTEVVNGQTVPLMRYTPYIMYDDFRGQSSHYSMDATDGVVFEGIPYSHDFAYYDLLAEWRRFTEQSDDEIRDEHNTQIGEGDKVIEDASQETILDKLEFNLTIGAEKIIIYYTDLNNVDRTEAIEIKTWTGFDSTDPFVAWLNSSNPNLSNEITELIKDTQTQRKRNFTHLLTVDQIPNFGQDMLDLKNQFGEYLGNVKVTCVYPDHSTFIYNITPTITRDADFEKFAQFVGMDKNLLTGIGVFVLSVAPVEVIMGSHNTYNPSTPEEMYDILNTIGVQMYYGQSSFQYIEIDWTDDLGPTSGRINNGEAPTQSMIDYSLKPGTNEHFVMP